MLRRVRKGDGSGVISGNLHLRCYIQGQEISGDMQQGGRGGWCRVSGLHLYKALVSSASR